MGEFRVGDIYKYDLGDEIVKIVGFYKDHHIYISVLIIFGDEIGKATCYDPYDFEKYYTYERNDDDVIYEKYKPGDKVSLKYDGFIPEIGYESNGYAKKLLPLLNQDVLKIESVGSGKWLKIEGCHLELHKSRFELVDSNCTWKQEFDDGEWVTKCGERFLLDGTPNENGMKFCCYCGKKYRREQK